MTANPHRLDRSLVIHAPRDMVFRYFTDSERFARWWGQGSTIDCRVGGAVHIVYPNRVVAGGVVTRLEPDRRIAFTYGYEDVAKPIRIGGSLVTVELQDHAEGTLLQLRHDLPTEIERDHHVPGWRFQLALFANVVANENHEDVATKVDQWFRGWADTDGAARERLIAGCTTSDVTMRDNYSCLRGRDDLLDHIRMSQMFMPGVVTTRIGPPRHCQGFAIVEWSAADGAGNPRGRGTNVVRLAVDGKIASIVGFW